VIGSAIAVFSLVRMVAPYRSVALGAVNLALGGWLIVAPLAGLVNGITTWALLFLLWITAVLFGTANLMGAAQQGANGTAGGGFTLATWTGFWSLLVGLVLTAVGGILGGRMRRPVVVAEQGPPEQPHVPRTDGDSGSAGRTEVFDESEMRGRPRQ
jgi:hypothetical protein